MPLWHALKGKQAKNTQNLNITISIEVTLVAYHRLQSHTTSKDNSMLGYFLA